MVNSIGLAYVTLSSIVIGDSLYTLSSLMLSPMGVLTGKSSCKNSGSVSKLATKGVTNYKVYHGSKNAYIGKEKT